MRDIDYFFDKGLNGIDLLNRPIENESADNRKRMGVTIRNGDPLILEKETDNLIFLESGEHGGATINKGGITVITGASGASFTGHINIKEASTTIPVSVIFNNCHFEQTKQNTDRFVTIDTTSRVVFNNCSFRRYPITDREAVGSPAANAAYVSINTSAAGPAVDMVNFVSCIFEESGNSGTTTIVNNIGTGLGTGTMAYCINKTNLGTGIPFVGELL
jgi:hypothetical protein